GEDAGQAPHTDTQPTVQAPPLQAPQSEVPQSAAPQSAAPQSGTGASPAPQAPHNPWPQLVGAEFTYVWQRQSPLHSPYQGPNSLDPRGDSEPTYTMGIYLGWEPLEHLQLYFDTEKFMGAGVSGATGLGGLTNGEVVRAGAENLPKRVYIARLYVRYL